MAMLTAAACLRGGFAFGPVSAVPDRVRCPYVQRVCARLNAMRLLVPSAFKIHVIHNEIRVAIDRIKVARRRSRPRGRQTTWHHFCGSVRSNPMFEPAVLR